MTNTTHTPGPWRITGESHRDYEGAEIGTGGKAVAVVLTADAVEATAEDEANGRLIAAAPDLLEAVQETLGLLSACLRNAERLRQREFAARIGTMISVDRAVIAQATGGEAKKATPNILAIQRLLADHGFFADIWSIKEVKLLRPGLTDEQCMDVLAATGDSGQGITQETIASVADDLFSQEDRP